MTTPINPLQGLPQLGPIEPIGKTPPSETGSGKDFKTILIDSLNEVNKLQQEADQKVQALYSGKTDNVADVFAAINKADVAFDLLMQIRNKLTDAYEQLQQMRV